MWKVLEDSQTTKKQLEAKDELLKQVTASRDELQAEVDRLKFFIERIEHDRKPLEDALEQSESKRLKCKQALAKYLRILQEKSNTERKAHIASQSVKLGQLIHKRVGGQFKQVWEDGDELLQLKTKYQEAVREREGLQKIQRSKKCRKIMEQATAPNGTQPEPKEIDNLFAINNPLELTESLFKIDEVEQKEFLTFKISMMQKEEAKLKEKLDQLKREKASLSAEMKRQTEELNSTLCGKKSSERFPILNEKYMILSLLGKGGYSEVYRAYDLEN